MVNSYDVNTDSLPYIYSNIVGKNYAQEGFHWKLFFEKQED